MTDRWRVRVRDVVPFGGPESPPEVARSLFNSYAAQIGAERSGGTSGTIGGSGLFDNSTLGIRRSWDGTSPSPAPTRAPAPTPAPAPAHPPLYANSVGRCKLNPVEAHVERVWL